MLFAGVLTWAQGNELLVSVERRTTVTIHDAATGASRPLYEAPFYVYSVRVSNDGNYVAVQEGSGAGEPFEARRLMILDQSGEIVFLVEKDVQRYAWCCRSSRLAIITGPERETDLGFEPEGIYLVDPAKGLVDEIEGIPRPYDVHGATFDGAVYIRNMARPESTQVFRYDWQTRTLSSTTHKGIFFSPDGQYYFDSYTQLYGLYRTEDDFALTDRLSAELRRWGSPWWLPGSAHRLVLTERRYLPPSKGHLRQSHVIDPQSGAVIESFRGDVGGLLSRRWATNAPGIVIKEESTGKLRIIPSPAH